MKLAFSEIYINRSCIKLKAVLFSPVYGLYYGIHEIFKTTLLLRKSLMQRDVHNHGPTLPMKCAQCRHSGLNLTERKNLLWSPWNILLRFFGGSAPVWHLQCPQCHNQTEIPPAEIAGIKEINHMAHNCRLGKINKNDFYSTVAESKLTCVKDLIIRSRQWTCCACSCENPATFEFCWNCNTEHPEPEKIIACEKASLHSHTDPLSGHTTIHSKYD